MRPAIRCVTFDLDDTLWETGPVIARAETVAHEWLVAHAPGAVDGRSHAELLAHRREFYATLPHLSHDFTALRRAWLQALVTDAGLAPALAESAFGVFWRARNEVAPFTDVMAVIERLRESVTLGTITNGNACVEHIGIGHHFHFNVTAADAGAMKPHPDIFAHALARAGASPAEAVHVGDDPVADVGGARDFGMRTVWVNPAGTAWQPAHGGPPDAVVRRAAEIGSVLARLR